MSIIAIVQARMGSLRLPNKVMKYIDNHTIIEFLLKRLNLSKEIDKIVVATSTDPNNKVLINHVRKLGFECESGSEDDVLNRYLEVAKKYKAKVIVRITGDCPLVDSEIVDKIIKEFKSQDIDYISNTLKPNYPDGLDVEVFTLKALKRAHKEAKNSFDREHVTPYIKYSNLFKTKQFENNKNYSHLRLTVDDLNDFETVSAIVKNFLNQYLL